MSKTQTIKLPNAWGEYESHDAEFLGRGSFATCYRIGNRVYSFVKNGDKNNDYSKEAIAEFASGLHVPDIRSEGDSQDEKHKIYSMPFYSRLMKESPFAWQQAKKLQVIWKRILSSSAWQGSKNTWGYEYNNKIIDAARIEGLPESIIESLESIGNACANYGDKYFFEFSNRNLKIDAQGNLIFLDIVFNGQALFDLRK